MTASVCFKTKDETRFDFERVIGQSEEERVKKMVESYKPPVDPLVGVKREIDVYDLFRKFRQHGGGYMLMPDDLPILFS